MSEFFKALASPDVPVIRYALVAGLLSSVALGIIGTYVITRRISYIAGAISHSVLGGIGAALYVQVVWHCRWCDPMFGAVAAALASAVLIGGVSLRAKQREDTVIGAIWSVGMAIGAVVLRQDARLRRPDELPLRRYSAADPRGPDLRSRLGRPGDRAGRGLLQQVSGRLLRPGIRPAPRRSRQCVLHVAAVPDRA